MRIAESEALIEIRVIMLFFFKGALCLVENQSTPQHSGATYTAIKLVPSWHAVIFLHSRLIYWDSRRDVILARSLFPLFDEALMTPSAWCNYSPGPGDVCFGVNQPSPPWPHPPLLLLFLITIFITVLSILWWFCSANNALQGGEVLCACVCVRACVIIPDHKCLWIYWHIPIWL